MTSTHPEPSPAGAAAAVLRARFHDDPVVAISPGRVNLIGDHVDYNDGFVLPCAIDAYAAVAARPRSDRMLRAHAVAFDDNAEVSLRELRPGRVTGWFAYVAGVAWALGREGHDLPGMDLAVAGDIPIGRGLASSAALELATAYAMSQVSTVSLDAVHMARLCQRAEHEFVGMACGPMDQVICSAARPDHALLIDCRTLDFEPVSLPADTTLVIIDTGVERALSGSVYNERRATCERSVRALRRVAPGIQTLRDVDDFGVPNWEGVLPPDDVPLVRHVIDEMTRPARMAEALRASDLDLAGRLMNASHASLRDLYRVSCDELELACTIARAQPGCFGARMTGAGFGGCAVALVDREATDRFVTDVQAEYRSRSGRRGAVFTVKAVRGAQIISA